MTNAKFQKTLNFMILIKMAHLFVVYLSLIISQLSSAQTQMSPDCKVMAYDFGYMEPHKGVLKNSDGYYAITNKKNRPQVTNGVSKVVASSDIRVKRISEQLIVFEKEHVGPFKKFEEAQEKSCESYYESKIYFIKNFRTKKESVEPLPVTLVFNHNITQEDLKKTFNQDISCNFGKLGTQLGSWSADSSLAYIFEYKNQFWAYNVGPSLSFEGPFKSEKLAATKACQTQFAHAKAARDLFKIDAKEINPITSCPDLKRKVANLSLFKSFKLRLGVERVKTKIYMSPKELLELNRSLTKNLKYPQEKSELVQYLQHPESSVLKKNWNDLSQYIEKRITDEAVQALFEFDKKFWKFDFEPINLSGTSEIVNPQIDTLPWVSTGQEEALENGCKKLVQIYGT